MDESRRLLRDRGFTLIELIAAAALVSVIAGGTMIAFVTALNISRRTSSSSEAAHLIQQTTERFRNRVACDDAWFDPATCNTSGALPTAWTADAVVPAPPIPTTRTYRVLPADCDGDGTAGDCLMVQTRVQWTPPS